MHIIMLIIIVGPTSVFSFLTFEIINIPNQNENPNIGHQYKTYPMLLIMVEDT